MTMVNMDSIDFYQHPTKAGSASDMRHKASSFRIPTALGVGRNSTALRPSSIPRLQEYDPIEFRYRGVTSLNESLLNPGWTPALELDDTEVNTENNSIGLNATHGDNRNNSEEDDDLPTLEELLRSAEETQKPQQLHSSSTYITGGSEGSFCHDIKNDCHEVAGPRSRVGESKKKPIILGEDRLEESSTQDARQVSSSGSSIHINDGSRSEEQVWDQGGKPGGGQDSTSTPPTSVASSEAGYATLHEKKNDSTSDISPPGYNAFLWSNRVKQACDSIDTGRKDIKPSPPANEVREGQQKEKKPNADDKGERSSGDDDGNTPPLLRASKKRRRHAGGKKTFSKRRINCSRFSSPLFSDEESEVGTESNVSISTPSKRVHIFTLQPSLSDHSGSREKSVCADDALECAGKSPKRRSLSRTAVVYEQKGWEGEIIQERDAKRGRGRPRKQYLVRWKESWVDGAHLTAPELLQNWRETKVSSK